MENNPMIGLSDELALLKERYDKFKTLLDKHDALVDKLNAIRIELARAEEFYEDTKKDYIAFTMDNVDELNEQLKALSKPVAGFIWVTEDDLD